MESRLRQANSLHGPMGEFYSLVSARLGNSLSFECPPFRWQFAPVRVCMIVSSHVSRVAFWPDCSSLRPAWPVDVDSRFHLFRCTCPDCGTNLQSRFDLQLRSAWLKQKLRAPLPRRATGLRGCGWKFLGYGSPGKTTLTSGRLLANASAFCLGPIPQRPALSTRLASKRTGK